MRQAVFEALYEVARKNEDVILLVSDTGAIVLDQFRAEMPERIINVGIAEQNMIGVAAGLAMEGKKVYAYAIIPFVTMRCYEQIRVDLCCESLPVKLLGVGPGYDYSTLGPTHHGLEDMALMRALPGMQVFSPCDETQARVFMDLVLDHPGPSYLRLDRTGTPLIYAPGDKDFTAGWRELRKGRGLCIVATGGMVRTALAAAEALAPTLGQIGVIDLYRVKPLPEETLWQTLSTYTRVATLEEHSRIGGMGSAVAELLAERAPGPRLMRLGLADQVCRQYGSREDLLTIVGLELETVTRRLRAFATT
ncbi:MAG: hypothetical protein A2284_03150 [Deltaproteobacteria bacterium RIFOXYA12_FULL_61_11]|nr:MAG: hypothetical protein A2284_03150 [Deltaproteobacteria bacterium RIFOXYA12_FULL_61_11]